MLTKVTYSMILGASLNVLDYGAATTNTAAQNVTAFQAALNAANSNGGAEVIVPAGTYLLNASLSIYQKTTLRGQGSKVSVLSFSNTGDGIKSTWPINSSTAVNITIDSLGIVNTSGAATGGGFSDVGGSFVYVRNCNITGFAYGIIFDQTEVAEIFSNTITSNTTAQLWFVEGADHTVTAATGFTNGINIIDNQFNGSSSQNLVNDDAFANHVYQGNNFNGGNNGLRCARVGVLNVTSNNFEGQTNYGIFFANTTSKGTAVVGRSSNVIINNNGFSNATASPFVYLSNLFTTAITGNGFASAAATPCLIAFNNPNTASNVFVNGNSKLSYTNAPFFDPGILGADAQRSNNLVQLAYTGVPTPVGTGQVTIVPYSMEGIYIGSKVYVCNSNGTNGEVVTVESITSTSCIVTFTIAKTSDPYLLIGLDNRNIVGTLANSATPSVYLPYQANSYLTGGTTTITNLTGGTQGQIITIMSKHSVTITNNTNILLSGATNYAMTVDDTLTLVYRPDYVNGAKWVEISRSVN